MSVKEIKSRGKMAFRSNYWNCVIAALLLSLLMGGATASGVNNAQETAANPKLMEALQSAPEEALQIVAVLILSLIGAVAVVSFLLKIFLFNPLKVGCYRFFVKNAEDSSASLDVIKEGFGGYVHTLLTLFLTDLFIVLWGMLFIIPGLVKAYSYRLVPYLIKENPELSAMEVITRSRELMNGNKLRAFLLDLSFIGWLFLGALTFGLVYVLWADPYYENACALFYLDVKGAPVEVS